MAGLAEAMNTFGLSAGLVLTFDQDFEIQKDGKSIPVLPVWKWLLSY